jgi:hypothetical protein
MAKVSEAAALGATKISAASGVMDNARVQIRAGTTAVGAGMMAVGGAAIATTAITLLHKLRLEASCKSFFFATKKQLPGGLVVKRMDSRGMFLQKKSTSYPTHRIQIVHSSRLHSCTGCPVAQDTSPFNTNSQG